MKTCSIEGCENKVWSKGLCLNHIKRKPLPASRQLGISTKVKSFADKEKINIMRAFFVEIWKKRRHYSEVSDTYLGSEPMSTYFHHILPKEKYPEACLDEENIILLTLEEHSNVEADMYRYEEVNKRRELLKQTYDRA
jgi:hypothetical protein